MECSGTFWLFHNLHDKICLSRPVTPTVDAQDVPLDQGHQEHGVQPNFAIVHVHPQAKLCSHAKFYANLSSGFGAYRYQTNKHMDIHKYLVDGSYIPFLELIFNS